MKHIFLVTFLLLFAAANPSAAFVTMQVATEQAQTATSIKKPNQVEKFRAKLLQKQAIEGYAQQPFGTDSETEYFGVWFWLFLIGIVLGPMLIFGGIVMLGATIYGFLGGLFFVLGIGVSIFGCIAFLVWLLKLVL